MISRDTYIELTKFAIVGAICFGLDLSLYYGLTVMLGLPTFVAKALSVISATMFNYYLNKTWTWGQSNHDPRRFAKYVLLYSISGLLNVLSNEAFLKWLPDNEFQMLIIHAEQAVQQPFFTIKIDKILATNRNILQRNLRHAKPFSSYFHRCRFSYGHCFLRYPATVAYLNQYS